MKIKPSELSKAIRKSPSNKLWDKLLKNWNEKDYKEFNKILNGEAKIIKLKERKVKVGLRVMRISDGKEYDSVKLCREENGFYRDQINEKLKLGIEFKRI